MMDDDRLQDGYDKEMRIRAAREDREQTVGTLAQVALTPRHTPPRLTEAEALSIYEAAAPMWDALAERGIVDSWDGMACRRILPLALRLIASQSNTYSPDQVKSLEDVS